MEDKKAKFIVYIVIALIAFIASSAVYSMTGGLSDWIATSDYDEDKNNNGYLDSSENGGGFFSLFNSNDKSDNSDNYNDDGSDWSELIDKGITVNVLNLGILSNDSVSTLLRNVLLSFAQFERDMIVERTKEGRAVARQKPGYREGRPKKYSRAQMDHAMELLNHNSYGQVVSMTGISKASLARERRRRKKAERGV